MRIGRLACCGLVLGLWACGVNNAPILDPVGDQAAAVGDELNIQLHASDLDGDPLTFSFWCDELPDLGDRRLKPSLIPLTDGAALFRWIPEADDARPMPYVFNFKISDGRAETHREVRITVRTQGGPGAPVFVQPIGSGTTFDLDASPCLELPIEVTDPDSTHITLAQEAPLIDGGNLEPSGAFRGTWRWCPTAAQAQTQDRFYLHLSADDGENPKTLKPPYLIVLVSSGKNNNCPGAAPAITHTPLSAQNTTQDIKLHFDVSDNVGLKATPLVYWSTSDPGSPPELALMTPVVSTRVAGDDKAGSYEATIPNPVAASPAGTAKTLYYRISARDNDDPTGGCNHITYAPVATSYHFTVTSTASGALEPCAPCTSDAQCGGPTDHCLTIGGMQRCGRACDDSNACPSDYTCTAMPVVSVGGASARQCLPTVGSCAAMATCTDDRFEENDEQASITNTEAQSLSGTSYPNLVLCPAAGGVGADEDWYGIPVSAEGTIRVDLTSSATTDLDLELVAADGTVLNYGLSTSSNEQVSACLPASAGKVYAHVFTVEDQPSLSSYALQITRTPMVCPCQPDAEEPDDMAAQANPMGRPTTAQVYSNMSLCAGNSDWFSVTLQPGDKLVVDLTFAQIGSSGDLDLHLFKPDGTTDLFPCSPTQSGCQINNGQSADANEHMEWTTPAGQGGTYYVVVRGYAPTDANTYSMSARVQ